jgi:ATP-dependent DNA helicase DinG
MHDLGAIFDRDGLLARKIPGFNYRPQQQAMACSVAEAIENRGSLICEAGTGTGKTFAYLVPALISGRKVIISTGTRNLQDQLYHRDLPRVRQVLRSPVKTALLKGRGNYLCRFRLDQAVAEGRRLPPSLQAELETIRRWSVETRRGDVAEVDVAEDSPLWPRVTSTTDNCLGQDCPDWDGCFLVEARRRAQEADLVVINHHLLCADLALKEEGFGEVLPGADCFVVDEAHQLPEVASSFFGESVGSRQLFDLVRDTETEYHREAGDLPEVPESARALRKAVQDLRLCFGEEGRRGPWRELKGSPSLMRAIGGLRSALEDLGLGLEALAGRGRGLAGCRERCVLALERLAMLCEGGDDNAIRWYETQPQGFRLHSTPLEIAGIFSAHMKRHPAAWIFTSATLAVGEHFEHFARQIGVEEAETRCWDSPFDYRHQALCLLPEGLPDPSDPTYNRAVSELAVKLVGYSRGRAFLLYTSHRALQEAAGTLRQRIPYPLLVQGDAPRGELVERFRRLGNAVLLGTSSFWEGVDVVGEALSCVVIDRLPFASPGDPVLQARIDALRQRGGNPFRDLQLPQAVIALKQGAGRLIRDIGDRGVLVVCDPRLLGRSYAAAFLESLPPMPRTRELEAVRRFFAEDGEGGGDSEAEGSVGSDGGDFRSESQEDRKR